MSDMLSQVRALLATTPAHWQNLTGTLAPELLARKPAPGEWSAVECLRHLVDTEREVFPMRVRAFLAGQNLTNWDPDGEGTPSGDEPPAALAAEFAQRRAASLALLAGLHPDDLDRTVRHSTYGLVTLRQMLHEWAAHDLNHTVQAEEALMQPFITGCGAWRDTFADHDIDSRSDRT